MTYWQIEFPNAKTERYFIAIIWYKSYKVIKISNIHKHIEEGYILTNYLSTADSEENCQKKKKQ